MNGGRGRRVTCSIGTFVNSSRTDSHEGAKRLIVCLEDHERIPYRNAGALFVLQRVLLASRATVPVLHDGARRSGPMSHTVSLDRSLTGIDVRPASSSHRHMCLSLLTGA